jgi:hypothetical protein
MHKSNLLPVGDVSGGFGPDSRGSAAARTGLC